MAVLVLLYVGARWGSGREIASGRHTSRSSALRDSDRQPGQASSLAGAPSCFSSPRWDLPVPPADARATASASDPQPGARALARDLHDTIAHHVRHRGAGTGWWCRADVSPADRRRPRDGRGGGPTNPCRDADRGPAGRRGRRLCPRAGDRGTSRPRPCRCDPTVEVTIDKAPWNPLSSPGRQRHLPAGAGILDQCPAARVEPDTRRDRRATEGATIRLRVTDDGLTSPARQKPVSGCSAWPNAPNSSRVPRRPGPRAAGSSRPCCPWTRCHDHPRCRCRRPGPRPRRARHDPRRVPGAGWSERR